MKKIISLLLFVLILISGVFYYLKHREDFYLITTVSAGSVIIVAFLIIISQLIYGLQLKILTDHYSLDLNFLQCFGLSRMATFINLWTPIGGGASFKAIYLKKFHHLKYSSYIASMAIANVIHILVNSLGATVLLLFVGKRIAMPLFVISAIFLAGTSSLFLFGHTISSYVHKMTGRLKAIFEEWEKIRKDRETVVKLIFLSFFIFLLSTVNIYLSFRAFSVEMSFLASGTIAVFTTITGVMNLLPGNFGIREAVIITISRTYGIEINESIHAAALGRLVQIIWTFILASSFRYNFSRKTADSHTRSSQGQGRSED